MPDQAVATSALAQDLTASFMLDIIEETLHAKQSEWIFLRELRVGTGRSHHSLQRLDGFALNCLPHNSMKRVCYEIKTSRADYLGEMKNPLKRRLGLHLSNEFFFATPIGMLSLDEVPSGCGLIEIGRATTDESQRFVRGHAGFFQFAKEGGWFCVVTIPAPWRDGPAPTWQFAAAMLRNQQRAMKEKSAPPPQQQKLDFT